MIMYTYLPEVIVVCEKPSVVIKLDRLAGSKSALAVCSRVALATVYCCAVYVDGYTVLKCVCSGADQDRFWTPRGNLRSGFRV